MKIKNKTVLKLKKLLPKDYNVSASPCGLTVFVSHRLKQNDEWHAINKNVDKIATSLHLDKNGSGLGNNIRDWDFTDLNVEKKLVADAKKLRDHIKAFFKKWSNEYCDTDKAYAIIQEIRDMLETDEA